MADKEHVRRLKEGVEAWNKWRKENQDVKPDLSGANLKGLDLRGVDFSGADVKGTNFKGAELGGTVFVGASVGMRHRSLFTVFFASMLISGLSGFLSLLPGVYLIYILNLFEIYDEYTQSYISLAFFITFLLIMIRSVRKGNFNLVPEAGAGSVAGTGAVTWAGAGAVTGAIVWGTTGAVSGAIITVLTWAIMRATIVTLSTAVAGTGRFAITVTFAMAAVAVTAKSVAVAEAGFCIIILSSFIAWRSVKGDAQFAGFQKFGIAFASFGGTNFQETDLTVTQFNNTSLKNSHFNNATTNRTCWRNAKQLEFACVTGTILENRNVRELLVTGKTDVKSFAGINLKGAYLADINLDSIDFTEADLSGATYENTSLRNTNLTKVQALGVEFRGADLTGACLESWNIDSATQLDGAHADYVYLLGNNRERRPSSGNFGEGEFSKLFQEVLDTVDLIFKNGIDWQAFMVTFDRFREKIRVESEDGDITVQSIENKGDGVFVVKVSVPSGTDKSEIHSEFRQEYDKNLRLIEEKFKAKLEAKDEVIALHRQHNIDLKEIIRYQAEKPIHIGDDISISAGKDVAVAKDQGKVEIKNGK